jgi:CubicO group peptidase (beta-lactamase class C family)
VLERAVARIATGVAAPPGVCLAVSRAGRIEYAARGVAQAFDDAGPLSASARVTPRTRADIGSVTKIVATTATVIALVDGGELTLERRLSELLPWTATTPCAGATIAQLLSHRAGLWEWWPLYLSVSASDPEAALRAAAALPLRYAPEHGRHYSDLGFMLLGAAVAAVGGREAISEVACELVLAPLGLTSTAYTHPVPGDLVMASSNGDAIERRMIATGEPYPVDGDGERFARWREHVLVGEINDGNAFHAFGGAAGHAGLFSTAEDLLRFGDALLTALDDDGDGERTGARPLARASVLRRFLTAGADPGQGLGLRCWRLDDEDTAWGHTGFPGVAVAILPARGASVALVTNRLHVHETPAATEPLWELALRAAHDHCLQP